MFIWVHLKFLNEKQFKLTPLMQRIQQMQVFFLPSLIRCANNVRFCFELKNVYTRSVRCAFPSMQQWFAIKWPFFFWLIFPVMRFFCLYSRFVGCALGAKIQNKLTDESNRAKTHRIVSFFPFFWTRLFFYCCCSNCFRTQIKSFYCFSFRYLVVFSCSQ